MGDGWWEIVSRMSGLMFTRTGLSWRWRRTACAARFGTMAASPTRRRLCSGCLARSARRGGAAVVLRGRTVRLRHPAPVVGEWARLHCRGAVADPQAGGRPGQDGSAGCRQSGAAASGGRVTAVWVPDAGHQAMRDLVRARLDAVHALRRARQQLSGFLLRQGCHYGRPAWTKLHRRWLAGLKFEQAVHHIVLEDYIAAIE